MPAMASFTAAITKVSIIARLAMTSPILLWRNLNDDPTQPLTTETDAPYSYFHVERTFSEFMLSDFGQQGGAAGTGPFDPAEFVTSQPGNLIASCQDCHMRDTVGEAVNNTIMRPTESTEHPNSGQPMHDLTGGNVWVPTILASIDSKGPNYDAVNEGLLADREAELTLDFGQGSYFEADDIFDGAARSLEMLEMAAVITDVMYTPFNGNLSFIVQNQTGHKLISGFPEGRRMFVNIKYFDDAGTLIHEVNPYDEAAGTLKGLTGYVYDDPDNVLPDPGTLSPQEAYIDELVYEMHGSSSAALVNEPETFHFVLSDGRYKDNRIPPKGFDIDNAIARLSEPVWEGSPALDYFSAEEYDGGYDEVSLAEFDILVTGAVTIEVTLNYQSTSREYIEFLRNEINGTGHLTLPSPGAGGDPAYLIQDPSQTFFAGMRAWGDTIWDLWIHNMNAPGAAPITIAAEGWDYSKPTYIDFAIEPAPSTVGIYNALALPLETEDEFAVLGHDYDAQGLMNYIGSSVQQVLRLNPVRQDFDTWYSAGYGFVGGIFTPDPYPLDTGGSYWVLVDDTAPSVLSLFGDVPAPGSLSFSFVGTTPCSYNSLSLPLDQSSITNAAELAAAMGDIDQVLRLNPARQDFDTWYVASGYGFINGLFTMTPDDFPVEIGYPYWVCVAAAGDGKIWPSP